MRSMLMPVLLLVLLLTGQTALAGPAPTAEAAFGRWKTQDGAAIVRIGRCGATVCGVTERVLDAKAPANDINNPDPKLRGRPIVGSTILSGFRQDGDGWSGGQAYSPKLGRSFNARLKVMPDQRLKVTGCLSIICQSIYWTRLN